MVGSENKFKILIQGPAETPDDLVTAVSGTVGVGNLSLSQTQSISVAMERWSVEHRVFAVETIFKINDSVIVTQLIFRRHFNIPRNECP
jgi:hypothetical protein